MTQTANNGTSGVFNLEAEMTWTDGATNEYSVVVDDLNHDGHKKIITGGATRGVWDYGGWIEWLGRIMTGRATTGVWDKADLRIWNYTNGEINQEAVKEWYMINVTNFTTIFTVTTGDINNDGHDEIITGGMEKGCFIEPTVFTAVTPSMRVAKEEIFGPVLCLVEVKDFDGVKLICEDESWLMFRPSGTEPLVRVYAEAKSLSKAKKLIKFGELLLKKR